MEKKKAPARTNPTAIATVIAATLTLAALVGCESSGPPSTTPSRRTVLVYGDSLSWESESYIRFFGHLDSLDVVVAAKPGEAPCWARGRMATDLRTVRPDVVVVAFSGNWNSTSTCMGAASTPDAVAARYAADLTAMVDAARTAGTAVVLTESPPTGHAHFEGYWSKVRTTIRHVGAATATPVLYAGADIAPGYGFTWTRPCGPLDGKCPPSGSVTVRSNDRIHLCPGDYRPDWSAPSAPECESPGAKRFAAALVRAAGLAR